MNENCTLNTISSALPINYYKEPYYGHQFRRD